MENKVTADYVDEEGCLHCGICGKRKQMKVSLMGFEHVVSCLCECEVKARQELDEKMQWEEAQRQLYQRKSVGLRERRFWEWKFENDNGSNQKILIARQYVENWTDMKRKNVGLLLMGPVGTGKSFFAGCIANALLEQGERVMMTNFSRILNEMTSYQADKNQIIQNLVDYPLLIIDDLGIERNSEFALEQVYNVIDSRYCKMLPLIVTTVRPPKLYDLTTLQREANRMFGYTAQQTLDAVQEMYEQKLVTYPRTDSQYLTDEMGESTETLIQMLLGKMPYAEGLEYQPDVSKVLNSKKVSDHHAIIPTVEVAKADIGKLKERNCKILYLISARVLTATADPYIYESHKCQITCNYHTFYLNAKKTKQEGFKTIEKKLKQFFGIIAEKEEPELDIWAGKHYGPCDSFVSEHFTQPPKQYTDVIFCERKEWIGIEERSSA